MREIFCLAEHRRGELRNVSLEILSKAKELADKLRADISAVLLGFKVEALGEQLSAYANKVLVVEDEKLANFNSVPYQQVLSYLMAEYKPIVTLIGHTSFGMDLAPSLAVETNLPLATDCIDVDVENSNLFAVRQMYNGQVNAKLSFREGGHYLVTVREGVFGDNGGGLKGEIVVIKSPLSGEITGKKFMQYIEPEASEVDITKADIIVSVGRGIKESKNIPIVEALAESLGGVLACSRPIVDSEWLTKDRQVGQTGKTVTPRLYIAVGISGAFQHLAGMRGSDTIVTINKNRDAPIFKVSNYGIIGDLFKVLPVLSAKIKEIKTGKR